MIRLSDLQKNLTAEGHSRLSCRIEIPNMEIFHLWIEVPKRWGHLLTDRIYDAFAAAVLVIAMKQKEDIEILGPCTQNFKQNISEIMEIWRRWFPDEFHRIGISHQDPGPAPEIRAARPLMTGCFFSGGVDSFYTLLKNTWRKPGHTVSPLITVHGFDVNLDNNGLFEKITWVSRQVAKEMQLESLPVKTNLRQLSDRFIDWAVYFEVGLVFTGHCLSGGLSEILIPATDLRGTGKPCGADSGLDRLWSNGLLRFRQDGAKLLRMEKLEYLSRQEIALKYLRVCWENSGNLYNCSRCEKCLRTMLALRAAGALKKAQIFDSRRLIKKILALYIPGRKQFYWRPILAELRWTPRDFLLRSAIYLTEWKSNIIQLKRGLSGRLSLRALSAVKTVATEPLRNERPGMTA